MSALDGIDTTYRPRRLRRTPAIRAAVQETRVTADDLVAPLFVLDGDRAPEDVASMPGVRRLNVADTVAECKELEVLGVRMVALFPCLGAELKDATASHALDEDGLVMRAVRAIKAAVPGMVVITDVALDPYTSHGHDGLLTADGTDVDNDPTVEILARMAVLHARAGADFVAPSDMMDLRVAALRRALDAAGCSSTGVIAYSAKFASCYYGPFRDAVGSSAAAGTHHLDKRTYQLNPANRREAAVETAADAREGADVLMVKPAGPYLDIIRETRNSAVLPVAAYQVSGEYAQIHAAAERGWLDLERTRDESLLAIKRAGADMIFTYFAKAYAAHLARK